MRAKLVPLLHLATVVVSVGLLLYGYMAWSVGRRHLEAQRLRNNGMVEQALEQYEALERDLGGSRWKRLLFESDYAAALPPQLALLYELARYDDAVERADVMIQGKTGDVAAFYFWSGNAFFQKGMTEDTEEDSFRWFNRSVAQLRKAMEEDRAARWNIRYNYELVKTAVEEVMSTQQPDRAKILRPREAQQSGRSKGIAG